MAKFSRVQVWNTMELTGLVPLFYNSDPDVSKKIIAALYYGGARTIEITNRGERAYEVFRELIRFSDAEFPDLILGVGSIIDAPTAGLYINLGAKFIVGPVFKKDLAVFCNLRKVVYCPGCATPTEISQAEEWGVEICKIFPGSQMGGPGFVKAVLAPCPWLKLMPTGGVDASRENLSSWFEAGVTCVGMGSKLVRVDLVEKEDWEGISNLTSQCLEWIKEARA